MKFDKPLSREEVAKLSNAQRRAYMHAMQQRAKNAFGAGDSAAQNAKRRRLRLSPDAPVVHNDAPVTLCPSINYDRRLQCAPGEWPFGAGFAALGVGRDISTGKEWGK